MIHPESVRPALAQSAAPAALQNPSFRAFHEELAAHGVEIFDPALTLLENLRETGREQYLRTDSHWAPEAVDAVARDLADRIHSLELSWGGAPMTWRRQSTTISGVGDLERSLMLPDRQKTVHPTDGRATAGHDSPRPPLAP